MALCKLPVCAFGGRTAALVLMGRLAMGGSAKKLAETRPAAGVTGPSDQHL